MYRGTWLLVGLPLLLAAFTVSRPEPLPAPTLPPTFDAVAAAALADELAHDHPDRSPGSEDALGAADWFVRQMRVYGFTVRRDVFHATIPGRGRVRLENLVAKAGGRSRETIAVLAHRDNTGESEGTNDNASGTGALIELARAYAQGTTGAAIPGSTVRPAHTIAFVSTDGGAFGALGAAELVRNPADGENLVAAISLDAVAGSQPLRLIFAGDEPRSPAPDLLQTAAARILDHTGSLPQRPSALRQLVDLAFPFTLHEQGPFVARGISAVTLTTTGERPPPPFDETELHQQRLERAGRSAQALLASLDEGLELGAGGGGLVFLGSRMIRGWAIQLVLIGALLPFLAAAVDLFARCRRRRIPLAPAFRSFRSRAGFWLLVGALFWLFGLLGVWPGGAPRPLSPHSEAVTTWPLVGLGIFGVLVAASWFVTRERLLPRRAGHDVEDLAGYTAALVALAVLSLVVVATNAYALLFLLPSLHAWLWLPQVRERKPWVRLAVLGVGFAGPLLLLASFGIRYGLGADAPWYVAELVAVGYVEPVPVLVFLVWLAGASQLAALVVRRYAPYPRADEGAPPGVLRGLAGRAVAAARARRAASFAEDEALEA